MENNLEAYQNLTSQRAPHDTLLRLGACAILEPLIPGKFSRFVCRFDIEH